MLNMRSSSPDLTTRARIRDAALELFGAQGFSATSVRAIADRADVSAALVIHHFGSKEELRAACDALIVDEIMGRKSATLADMGSQADLSATMRGWLADMDTFRPSFDYLARMIIDGGEAGRALFDALVDRTEAMIAEGVAAGAMNTPSDLRTTAVVVASYGVMPLLLERHIGRVMGGDGLTLDIVRRLTVPMLEIYTHGLYADDTALAAATAALEGVLDTSRGPHSDKGAGDPNQDPDPPE